MASKDIEVGLLMLLMAMILAGANAQSGCSSVILGLSSCLNYVTGRSSTPSSSCCSQLANVVKSQPQCLCWVLNGGGSSLGISINQTLALGLPGACKVQTPPVSRCNAADGPATPPVESPASSPADSSDNEPGSPIVPSANDAPAGRGSKSVPMTGSDASAGNIVSGPRLTAFLLFVASCAPFLIGF